jgi:hypothetical protein
MALITSGTFSKALWPGVNKWYGKAYDEFPVQWSDLFDQHTSRKAFEEDVGVSSFGLAAVKPEVTLGQYKGVEVKDPYVELTTKELEAEINKYLTNKSELVLNKTLVG